MFGFVSLDNCFSKSFLVLLTYIFPIITWSFLLALGELDFLFEKDTYLA